MKSADKQAKIIAGIKRVIDAQAAAERRKHDAEVKASNARENDYWAAYHFGPRKVYTYAQCPECGADGRASKDWEDGPQYDCVEPGCK